MYPTADELVAVVADTNNSWESRLDYELVQEILGHELSVVEWEQMIETLDDVVFETVRILLLQSATGKTVRLNEREG